MLPEKVSAIVKVPKGVERIAASYVEEALREVCSDVKVFLDEERLPGIVFVSGCDPDTVYRVVRERVPEASRVLPVYAVCRATLDEIAKCAAEVAKGRISRDETFAIRTTRRGKHSFTSIDVNVVAGRAVQEATGADVNLDFPDKAVYIEIFGDIAYLSVIPGADEYRKVVPGKPKVLPVLAKMRIVQMPYTGPLDAVYKMGVRIGRAAQTFEVGELVIAHYKPVSALELKRFLDGLFEGIESRFSIQERSYGRKPRRVPVYVYELFQFVRSVYGKEPIIVTDPKGEYITHVKDKLAELFRRYDRVNVLIGAREGIPVGIFRFADLVVDLSPEITISTDYALVSTVMAFIAALEEAGALEHHERRRKR